MARLLSFSIAALYLIQATSARGLKQHAHEAIAVKERRQAPDAPAAVPAIVTPAPVLTTVYPSPGASPLTITSQSQLITSFVPQFTLCELPPVAFFPITPVPSATHTTAPYLNYSASIPTGNGTCVTFYSPTRSMVCATVLTDLTTTYTVSQCSQDITFSTQYGYTLVQPTTTQTVPVTLSSTVSLSTITPPPSIQTLTTYYLAPWQDLTRAGPPGDVDYKICQMLANGSESCVLEYYKWKTSLLTISYMTTTSINITTTIPGPSQLLVETFVANITGTVSAFSMSTTMELETSTLSESTSSATKSMSTLPTVTRTQTMEFASS